jgi:hypothetical protein
MVVSMISRFVALGGTSYAAITLPKDSVGALQLRSGSVTPPKVAKSTVALFKGQRGPAGAQGQAGPAGPAGPAGKTGARGASEVWLRKSVLLPPGRYAVWGRAIVKNMGVTEYNVSCGMAGGAASLAFTAQQHVPAGKTVTVPVLATVTTTASPTQEVAMSCGNPPGTVTVNTGMLVVGVETLHH